MKITKVTYQKAFIIGPYLQEKVGFEAELEEPEYLPDGVCRLYTPEAALSKLKEMADEWHKKEYPHLYTEGLNGSDLPPHLKTQVTFGNGQSPTIDYKQIESLEAEIDDCITLEQLEQWVKDHPTFPGKLLSVINERRNALKNNT